MIEDAERRALIARSADTDPEVRASIDKLNELARAAVNLEQQGHRTNISIELFGAGFSTPLDPEIVANYRDDKISMYDVVNHPSLREMLEPQATGYYLAHFDLLTAILPVSAYDVIKLSRSQQNALEGLEMAESSRRHRKGEVQRSYLAAGGFENFEGMYAWGMIDHNGANVGYDPHGEQLRTLVRFATALPHVRYESRFTGKFSGYGASVKQFLVVNPRVAYVSSGFDQWYQGVRDQV